ncbi:BREX system ATP-binding domain-containing protein [Nostoc flagelliforme]|uniref:BREX system ATP-binding domain-containing protein n=1 Tax=Nostoc flagelliforme TaxID=1306274 RepID=UPI0030CC6A67
MSEPTVVTKVTAGFKGDVGVVPRQFLRQFVNILDLASENDEFDPMSAEGFEPTDLNEVELLIREGRTYFDEEPADIQGYAAVEF